MADPLERRDEEADALAFAVDEARRYLAGLDEAPVLASREQRFGGRLPEEGDGALAALRELVAGSDVATRSSGPRFFHFVTGGTTPAALAADWLTSLLDQNAFSAVSSPLGAQLEDVAVRWLLDLFELPEDWSGVLTSGATMANFVGLACGRRWWAQEHGVDVDERGFAGLPAVPVFSTPYLHASARKALGMVGLGRESPTIVEADDLEGELAALDGAPAIVIANAGDVNTGDFDPIARMADLAEKHRAWLHVDGAFGLFARLTPEAGDLAEGDRARGLGDRRRAQVAERPLRLRFRLRARRRAAEGAVQADGGLPPERRDAEPGGVAPGPVARRLGHPARLRAGRAPGDGRAPPRARPAARPACGGRARSSNCSRRSGSTSSASGTRPPGLDADELDAHNLALGEDVLADGRVFFGTTRYEGAVAFRPAIVNWRTTERDVDLIADVLLELGTRRLQAG